MAMTVRLLVVMLYPKGDPLSNQLARGVTENRSGPFLSNTRLTTCTLAQTCDWRLEGCFNADAEFDSTPAPSLAAAFGRIRPPPGAGGEKRDQTVNKYRAHISLLLQTFFCPSPFISRIASSKNIPFKNVFYTVCFKVE